MSFHEIAGVGFGIDTAWLIAHHHEIAGVIFGIIAVWLTTRQNVWCWPTGLVNVGLFIIVFYQARLYADMGLQVVYVLLCLYGWYEWLHGGQNASPLQVSKASGAALGGGFIAGVAFLALLGTLLRKTTNADLPYLDSSLTSFSLVAQFYQTRKWIENWILWIAVDVIYVGMYIYKRLYPTAGLYAVFLILATIGYVEWRKSLESQRQAAT